MALSSMWTQYDHSYLPFQCLKEISRIGFSQIRARPKSLRILIIESEEDVAHAEKYILEDGFKKNALGFNALQIWALSRIMKNFKNLERTLQAVRPHLIVTDVLHVGRDGLAVTRFIKTTLRLGVPVIIVSAKSSKGDIIRGFEAGADDYIVKPFDPADLMDRIFTRLRKELRS